MAARNIFIYQINTYIIALPPLPTANFLSHCTRTLTVETSNCHPAAQSFTFPPDRLHAWWSIMTHDAATSIRSIRTLNSVCAREIGKYREELNYGLAFVFLPCLRPFNHSYCLSLNFFGNYDFLS
jgi:hypothetical protein